MKFKIFIIVFIFCLSLYGQSSYNTSLLYEIPVPGYDITKSISKGEYLLTSSLSRGISVFDISDIANPHLLNEYNMINALDFIIKDSLLFVAAGSNGLKIFDISNFPNLNLIGSYVTNNMDAFSITMYNNNVIIGNRILFPHVSDSTLKDVFYFINVENPISPQLLFDFKMVPSIFAPTVTRMCVKDNYLFASVQYLGLFVFDISDINKIDTTYYSQSIQQCHAMKVKDNTLFLGSDASQLIIMDISKPDSINELTRFTYNSEGRGLSDIVFDDNLLLLSDNFWGLFIINIDNVLEPFVAGSCWPKFLTTGEIYRTLAIDENKNIILTENQYKIYVIKYDGNLNGLSNKEFKESTNLSLNCYPNPFNLSTTICYDVPTFSSVVIDILNALGEKVETIVNKEQNQGNYKIIFNASKLSSGVYLYRFQAGGFIETKKFILMK